MHKITDYIIYRIAMIMDIIFTKISIRGAINSNSREKL